MAKYGKAVRGVISNSFRKLGRFKCVRSSNMIMDIEKKKLEFFLLSREQFEFLDESGIWHLYMIKDIMFKENEKPTI